MVDYKDQCTNELQAEIARLNQATEILQKQLIKAWRDMANLQDTNSRLFNENQELHLRIDARDSVCTLVPA